MCPKGQITKMNVVFPEAFTEPPVVIGCIKSNTSNVGYGNTILTIADISNTGFTAQIINNGAYEIFPGILWVAF